MIRLNLKSLISKEQNHHQQEQLQQTTSITANSKKRTHKLGGLSIASSKMKKNLKLFRHFHQNGLEHSKKSLKVFFLIIE